MTGYFQGWPLLNLCIQLKAGRDQVLLLFCVTQSVHRSGKKAYTGNVLFVHLNQTMNFLKKCFAVMFILGFKPGKEGSKTVSQERKNL